jgi:glycosyltransferase XagB
MTVLEIALIILSILLTIQAAHTARLMLYAWEDQHKRSQNQAPRQFIEPKLTFTILLPARHEEDVIQDTIQRMVDLDYPRRMVEVLVILEAGDHGTMAYVDEKISDLAAQGIDTVRLITFDDPPINKPHGLNAALPHARGDVVVIFDAEDEPHPQILQLINTIMVKENAPVVQSGVQLMNFADHWFSALNVLEYFFWFKSRLHYHARLGSVPLGGNTIFMNRQLLQEMGGWDQDCLTEDADLGIRMSAAGIPIRVVYDDRFVTHEETPPTVDQFIRQRTRWTQGFLQVLFKGDWRRLPTMPQRLLALYTLSFPLVQALLMLYVPFSIYLFLYVSVSDLTAMIVSLPLYMLAAHLAITMVGLFEFASAHNLRLTPWLVIRSFLVYMPYQWMINYAAFRALLRHLLGINNWEKTVHTGAHRQGRGAPHEASKPVGKPAPSGGPPRTASGASTQIENPAGTSAGTSAGTHNGASSGPRRIEDPASHPINPAEAETARTQGRNLDITKPVFIPNTGSTGTPARTPASASTSAQSNPAKRETPALDREITKPVIIRRSSSSSGSANPSKGDQAPRGK